MLERLEVPAALQRNSVEVAAAGFDYTGQLLINLATKYTGLQNLENIDVLDIGCGVRFTSAIINCKIPIKSYTGVEVDQPIVRFLQDNVEVHDKRFKFVHYNVHNEKYNPCGIKLARQSDLPVNGSFDLIWLFSVFTHLNPEDSLQLLRLMKKHLRKSGRLFFLRLLTTASTVSKTGVKISRSSKPIMARSICTLSLTRLVGKLCPLMKRT